MKYWILGAVAVGAVSMAASAALARCTIKNETKYSFTIESGNVSNQRVGSHTTTSIASGRIKGKSDDGKGIGGSCRDGETVRIIEDDDVVMIVND